MTQIGEYAFAGCTGLRRIEIPEGVTAIGRNAFEQCTSLTEAELGSGLTSIEISVFDGCSALERIVIPDSVTRIERDAFRNASALSEVRLSGSLTYLGGQAFDGCENLTEIEIPASLEEADYYFGGPFIRSGLKTVTFEEGTTRIARRLFDSCSTLEEIELPESVTQIGEYAFAGCTGLRRIEIPEGVTAIGRNAFEQCTSLTEAELGSGLTSIEISVFDGCSALERIVIPDSVTRIERDAFRNASALSEVRLSGSLTYLGGQAFDGCENLTEIEIPASLEEADYYFGGPFIRSGLKTVTFEEGTTRIARRLFDSCSTLEEIELPESVTQIGEYAFASCTNLAVMSLGRELTQIDAHAFDGCSNLRFYVEYGTKSHICAIENRLKPNLTSFGYEDYTDLAIQPGCTYYADFGSLSSSGYVKVSLHYELSEEKFSQSGQHYIRFYLPQGSEIFRETIKADGEIVTEYTEEDGVFLIPIEKPQGDISYGFSPAEVSDLVTAAIYEYQSGGRTKKEVLGYDNSSRSILTVSCDDQVASPEFTVTGLGEPSAEIRLYLNGTLLTTVTALKNGTYRAAVTIPDPVSGAAYILEARNGADESQRAQTVFRYDDTAPELTEFKLYYNNHRDTELDLLNAQTKQYVSFNPKVPFTFTVRFDDAEAVEQVYIVSTRNNERKLMEAEYDPASDQFIASGYFDESNRSYVPGTLSVEYRPVQDEVKVGQDVDWDSMYQSLSADMKKTKITTVTEGGQQRYQFDFSGVHEGLRNTGIDLIISSIDNAVGTELDEWKSLGETLYQFGGYFVSGLDEDRYIAASHSDPVEYTLMFAKDSADLSKGAVKVQIRLQKDSEWTKWDDAAEQLSLVSSGLSAASDIYGFAQEREELVREIYQSPDIKDKEEAVRKANELFEDQKAYTILMTLLPMLVTSVGVTGPVGIGFTGLVAVIGTLSALLWQYRVNHIKGEEVEIRWAIDPSGYVYEAVESNRLSGVKTTAYYKEKPEDTEAILWDASEYDQKNPLYTDGNGEYAWDVPEGYWQVKYEKEGYETVYSDWLPVPPPQTEVNIGMVSKEKPVLESAVIYADHADLVFSKYMAPDTVSALKLTDEAGNSIPYTLVYDTSETNADGVRYAKRCRLQFAAGTVLVPGSACVLTITGTEKSYADVAMDSAVIPMAVRKNVEIIAPEAVTVAMGETAAVPVQIVNWEGGTAVEAVSEAEAIASVEPAEEGRILITGRIYGEVNVVVRIPGTDVTKTIRVTIGKQTEIPPAAPLVVLPQSVYRMTEGESLTIEPEIYPDSTLAGSWSVTDGAGIVALEGNTVTALAEGETVLRYTLADHEEIYAECTIIVMADGAAVTLPYSDVKEDDWFYGEVKYVYVNGIMTGYGDGSQFGPYNNLARAEFAQIIYRLEGEPVPGAQNRFPDVGEADWYRNAVVWAYNAGVVTGYSNGNFGPADKITREQMAVMMYRYAEMKGYDVRESADFSHYQDAANVSPFAGKAMSWAVAVGLISGKYGQTRLDPQGSASRAECAIILTRFMQIYNL